MFDGEEGSAGPEEERLEGECGPRGAAGLAASPSPQDQGSLVAPTPFKCLPPPAGGERP